MSSTHGPPGPPGIGFKLTDNGNYDIDRKRLTNLAESVDDNDAVTFKVLKDHTQVSQNNYHLQPSFKIYKNFGDKSRLTVGKPPNTPSNHFFNNHKAHYNPYIVDKEADDTGFSGEAWSSIIMKGNQLESGSYTSIFEIFVIGDAGGFSVDDTIIYQVWGDSHYTITTFDSDKINGQYTRSIIQFTTDGGAGADDGIKFQIKYFGSQYNKNIKFLFYSRVVKGKQSTSFDHTIFNVSDVQDNHTILYFENLNLNGNLIDGLGDPVKLANAANKNYVDIENAKQYIAIADKASKSYVNGEIAKIPHVAAATDVLKLDGSKAMTGDLNMGDNKIFFLKTQNDVSDDSDDYHKDLESAVNKRYVNTNFLKTKGYDFDLNQKVIKNSAPYDDGSYDDNTLVSKAYVEDMINKLPKADTDVLKLDGSKPMTGDLNMGLKYILNLDTLNDHTNNSERDKDLRSAVNKPYLNTHFLKIKGHGEFYFNLDGQTIKNCTPYYDGLFDDNSLVSKAFVDAEIAKIPHVAAATDVLKLDGSKAMTGDLDMANHNLINLKDPQPSDSSHAASVNFVNTSINNSNSIIDGIIDRKIEESETRSIESIDRENVFKKVMDDDEFKEDHDKIHKVGVENKNFHLVNKKTYEFKIDYDSSLDYYSTRLAIDLIYLPVGSYTMVYEMYVEDGITIDEIDATSGTLTVGKINSRIDGTNTRSIIHFTKYTISSGFDDLEIDLKLKSKTDPQTTIYVIVYGVKGYVNNVSTGIWDRLYYYDGSSAKYEVPIDMNSKDITNVNKITTKDLDVNGQIDMKGNKIIGVGNGTTNSDAVNKAQLESVISLFNTVNNTVAKNSVNIAKINVSNSYHFFTDQLKHNKSNTVKFPTISNNYPYSATNGSELLRILLDGHYHIIYTDFHTKSGQFIIHDDTNGNDLFVVGVQKSSVRASIDPIIINTVIPINTDNGFNHADIKLYIKSNFGAVLEGVRSSTFFIKYVGP